MKTGTAEKEGGGRAARGLAGWLTLAAVPYLAWKIAVAGAAGVLSAAMTIFLCFLGMLAAIVLFSLGALLGGKQTAVSGCRKSGFAPVVITWAAFGLVADTAVGLTAANYFSQVAAALGDSQVGGFWTDIGFADALLFLTFSLAGGFAGGTAAAIYRMRSQELPQEPSKKDK